VVPPDIIEYPAVHVKAAEAVHVKTLEVLDAVPE